jgi:hypothetical protein
MRVRDLKFGTINAWPPTWRAVPGRQFVFGEQGVLVAVRVRSRDSLTVHILANDQEYEGLLVWDGRPSPRFLADLLNGATGKSIQEIGELRIPDEAVSREALDG